MTAKPTEKNINFKDRFWELSRTDVFQREMDIIWSSIRSRISQEQDKTFLVCSSTLHEGNTTVTVGLANFVAMQTGKDVLVIDANCREDGPRDLFANGGLVPLIEEPHDQYVLTFDEYETSMPNMRFLTFRNPGALETVVVNYREMESFMAIVERRYDYVFVDAPPLLDSNIAAFLARHMDKVIFVLAASERPVPVLKEALARLEDSKDRVIGAIINKREHPIPGYLYRFFR